MRSIRVVTLGLACCWASLGGGAGALAAQESSDPSDVVTRLASEGRHAWTISDAEFAAKRSAIVRRFEVPITESGALTLDLRSTQVDPLIRVLDADGTQLHLDDDSGIEWNAHLELQVEAGDTLHLEGISQAPHGGELEFELRHGAHPLPSGDALVEATARFRRARGGFLVSIGDTLRGATEIFHAAEAWRQLRDGGSYAEAYREAIAAVSTLEHDRGQRDLIEAASHAFLVGTALSAQGLDAAREHLERAEELAAELDSPGLAQLVRSRHVTLLRSDPATAVSEIERASVELIDEHDAAGDVRNSVLSRLDLVNALLERGRPARAEPWLSSLRGLVDGLEDPVLQTDLLLAELGLLLSKDELRHAQDVAERAVELAPYEQQRLSALIYLGDILAARGRYGEALGTLSRARELSEQLGDMALRAAALQRLARVAMDLDDARHAVVLLEESLASMQEGRFDPASVERSLQLVFALARAGKSDEAENLLRKVERSGLLDRHPALPLQFHQTRASLAKARGDVARERAETERALEVARAIGLPTHLAHVLQQLAGLARRAGDAVGARAYSEEALVLAEQVDHAGLLTDALVEHGRVCLATGELRAATETFRRVEQLVLEQWVDVLGDRWGERLRAAERSERLARLGQDLAAAELASATPGSAAWRSALAEGLRRADQWKGRDLLSQRRVLNGARLDDDLLQALERRFGAGRGDLLHFAEGASQLYVYGYVGGSWQHRALGDLDEVGAEALAHLGHVAQPASLGSVADVAASGTRLHERLIAPLELGGERDLVVIDSGVLAGLPLESLVSEAPAGATRFAELRFVLDDLRVSYAPSASNLVLSRPVPRRVNGDEQRELVVIADPAFALPGSELESVGSGPAVAAASAASGASIRGGRRVFARLPGTRAEALAIARAYLAERRSAQEIEALLGEFGSGSRRLDASGLHLRLGEEATRDALLELVGDAAIVHLATHGVQDPYEPRRSALALAPSAGDAGELYLGEILDWSLTAELAVLSACETASGSVRHGEGMRSLAWSFLRAGAGAVVATLWQVDDRESEVLMRTFYADYLVRRDASAALHAARLALRNAPPESGAFLGVGRGKRLGPRPAPSGDPALAGHPFFWASFIHLHASADAGVATSAVR